MDTIEVIANKVNMIEKRLETLSISNTSSSNDLISIKHDMNRIYRKVEDLCTMLTGNGDPEKGLVFRVEQNSGHRRWMAKFGWIVVSMIASIISISVIAYSNQSSRYTNIVNLSDHEIDRISNLIQNRG